MFEIFSTLRVLFGHPLFEKISNNIDFSLWGIRASTWKYFLTFSSETRIMKIRHSAPPYYNWYYSWWWRMDNAVNFIPRYFLRKHFICLGGVRRWNDPALLWVIIFSPKLFKLFSVLLGRIFMKVEENYICCNRIKLLDFYTLYIRTFMIQRSINQKSKSSVLMSWW